MLIKVTQGQHTPAGHFLGHLYLRTQAMSLFDRNDRGGFPYDGGQHSLLFFLDPLRLADVEAWLDIVENDYGHWEGAQEFLEDARAKVAETRAKGWLM